MKLIDKLKNALFEEEEVEVPDKPVKPEKHKSSIDRIKEETRVRDVKVTNYDEDDNDDSTEEEEEVVAKKIVEPPKIVTPKKEEVFVDDSFFDDIKVNNDNSIPTSFFDDDKKEKKEESHMFDDRKEVKEEVHEEKKVKIYGEEQPYKPSQASEYVKKYNSSPYGTYPKNKEKHVFKPSPNISPVYGIIDDPEPRTEAPKQEIRLTSALSNEKIDIDEVRNKALGIEDDTEPVKRDEPIDEDFIDLTNSDAPSVNKVTMGDAEEYYNDLGLEYNNDYIDANKTNTRVKSDSEYEKVSNEESTTPTPVISEETRENNDSKETSKTQNDDDNLFDLIDSLYDNKDE